jgi:hypothetical protein
MCEDFVHKSNARQSHDSTLGIFAKGQTQMALSSDDVI